jgi:hypothetical protein
MSVSNKFVSNGNAIADLSGTPSAMPCNTCDLALEHGKDTEENDTYESCQETATSRKRRAEDNLVEAQGYFGPVFDLPGTGKKVRALQDEEETSPPLAPTERECSVCAKSFLE